MELFKGQITKIQGSKTLKQLNSKFLYKSIEKEGQLRQAEGFGSKRGIIHPNENYALGHKSTVLLPEKEGSWGNLPMGTAAQVKTV